MAEVPALLGWWHSEDTVEEVIRTKEPLPDSSILNALTPAEASIYAMIMGRSPGVTKNAAGDAPNGEPTPLTNGKAANLFVRGNRSSIPVLPKGAKPYTGNGHASSARVSATLAAPANGLAHAPDHAVAEHAEEHTDEAEEPALRTANARILDLSQSGISLLSNGTPNGDPPVWVCLQGGHPTEWVEASIRAVSRQEHGLYLVRLEFRDVCPYEFFKAAVYGYFGS